MLRRRYSLAIILIPIVCSPSLLAQVTPPPITCSTSSAPLTVRAEGLTDLVGDVVINCFGGQPVEVGQALPQVNIQVFTQPSINITSRLLRSSSFDNYSEALLLIDEPAPPDQVLCPPPGGILPPNCIPTAGTYRGNVFQAKPAGGNSLIWQGVPINPPGVELEDDPDHPGQKRPKRRICRITNVRVNASLLSVGSSRQTANLGVFVSITSPTLPIQVTNPSVLVGTIQPSMNFTVFPISVPHCEPQNAQMPGQPASSDYWRLRFQEGFASSFKRRNIANPNPPDDPPPAPTAQDALGFPFQTESGFMKGATPSGTGWPTDAQQGANRGLADHGTRLMARFINVQNGVQLWVESSPQITSVQARTRTGTARLVNTDPNGAGPFSAPPSTGVLNDQGQQVSLYRVPIQGGTGQAVWEVTEKDPLDLQDVIEAIVIRSVLSFNANGTLAGSPAEGTINVSGSFAPLSSPGDTLLSGSSSAIPRFYGPPAPLAADANQFPVVTLHSCSGAPPQLNLTGALQGTLIVNYPQDSSLPRPVNAYIEAVLGAVGGVRATPTGETLAHLGSENALQSNWLETTVTEGTTPATVTVAVHPQGLAPGQYDGRIDISSPQASNTRRINVTLNVSQQGPFFLPGTVNHGASYAAGFLTPGAVTTIFGLRFGPDQPASLALGPNGRVTTFIGQTRVLIDGVAAPMIATVKGQLSFFAPFSLAGKTSAAVQVEYQGVRSLAAVLPVIDVAPGLFTLNAQGFGQGAILNQDLLLNGPNNPANRGDVVVLFGTGYGQSNPAGQDGKQAAAPLPAPLQPMSVFIDGKPGIIEYQGAAPSLTEGIFQINVHVPVDATPGDAVPVEVRQGTRRSPPGVTLAVRQ